MVCKPPKIRFMLEYCFRPASRHSMKGLLFCYFWHPDLTNEVQHQCLLFLTWSWVPCVLSSSLESVQVCFGGYFVEDQPVSTKNIVSTLHRHQHSHSQTKQTKLGSICASFIRTRSVSKIKVAIQVNTRIYSSADNADSKFVSKIHIPGVFQSVMWCRCTAKLNLTSLRQLPGLPSLIAQDLVPNL